MKIEVLDHGYVELIECWGHGRDGYSEGTPADPDAVLGADYEVGIVEAARQSTQGSFRGWDRDAKLLEYLYSHRHDTPFEFAGLVVEVQAPIFVFREWHRHRTQSYNEMSARYAPLPDLYYRPTRAIVENRIWDAYTTRNLQAQAASPVARDESKTYTAGSWIDQVKDLYDKAEDLYQQALASGIPKELARIVMPVGHYSRMRASANLRNWLSFLTLRTAPQAQWEIRQYADAVGKIIAECFPNTWKLFNTESK